MNDPHVVSLQYHNEITEYVKYNNPPSISWRTPIFEAELSAGILTCTMKQHFASIEDARNAVEPYLRAWQIEAALRRGRGELNFEYDEGKVIDRSPRTGNVELETLRQFSHIFTVGAAVAVHRDTYPDPPARFHMNPNVDTMWHRYQGYLEGREPLQSMAYFCLTVIENDAGGGRSRLCGTFQIDRAVRDTLGDLTSDRGEPTTARKMTDGIPLTDKERIWIEAAVKALILRMGGYDPQNPFPTTLTMQDLPSLT
jgi:hypothetical protein